MSNQAAYLVGIKGVGMAALACILQDLGWQVAGCDTGESFITDLILGERGIPVAASLSSPVPPHTDLVVYSGAYLPAQVLTREGSPLPRTIPLAQALSELLPDRRVIAVAGVGGKTTTSAMLAVLLRFAGRDVGYYVGTGSVKGLEAPGAAGTDPYFVVEADEYKISRDDQRPKFALLAPKILITTNLLHDHPDMYPTREDTLNVYRELVRKLAPGSSWICSATDPLTKQILRGDSLKDIKVIQYGTDHPLYRRLELAVFGTHNRLDALAAVLAAMEAGLTQDRALQAIGRYRGAKRRQEKIGEIGDRLLYDDYGHHPHEITATIQAFRQAFPNRRLLLVFESHTYSRTEALLSEFAGALSGADLTFIMPIFESAREKAQPHTITPADLAALIPRAQALTWENAAAKIAQASRPGDLILTMGAGFVYKLHARIRAILAT